MKVQVKSKKGLKTTLSIIVDKSEIKKLDTRLIELQNEISLKGFRKYFLLVIKFNLVKQFMVR